MPMPVAVLLDKLRTERANLNELLAQIPPEQMTQPGAEGHWSVRDMLVHITWYDREVAGAIERRALEGGSPLFGLSIDERNIAMLAEAQALTLDEVLAESHQVFERLLAAAATLSEEDMADPARLGMPPEWVPSTTIAINTYRHYRQHIPALRAWVEGVRG